MAENANGKVKVPSDIEIAQAANIRPITEIAAQLGIGEDQIESYGRYKAKIGLDTLKNNRKQKGKLVLVTAISATSSGVGKSTVSVGLAQAMKRREKNVMLCLREPSLGPAWVSRAARPAAVTAR